jgi:rare lipoprotein A
MKAILVLLLAAGQALGAVASFYGHSHEGRLMANDRPFNPHALTAASWFYPLGSVVYVTCGARTVRVQVTDRGPALRLVRQGRVIDLSEAAFERIADKRLGLVPVKIEPAVRPPSRASDRR